MDFKTQFWCHDCNDAFVANPAAGDSLLASCPHCGSECLDYDTELQDAKKFEFANEVNGSIGGAIFGGIIGMLGFGGRPASDSQGRARILVHAEQTDYQPAWTVFDEEADALALQDALGHQGIICEVFPYQNSRFRLVFEKRDLERARKQLQNWAEADG